MKRAPTGLGPIVTLDRRSATPLHRQLYDGYRAAILDGRLRPGQRLPSTRSLALDLEVSRMPVVLAFEQLVVEGYVVSKVGAGSFVSPTLPSQSPPLPNRPSLRPEHRPGRRRFPKSPLAALDEPWLELTGPFRLGRPALDEFPAQLWSRLVSRQARRMSRRQMAYADGMGQRALREALASYLGTARSVRCSPEQIMVVSGSQQALFLSARALLEAGDPVWLEDPGYVGARDALLLAGAKVVGVPVDAEGLDVAAGIARSPSARAAYVTPSHQYPLGMTMSVARRLQLLEWARRRGAWVLEDDYDSECRYDAQPLESLHGLDADARVIYIGTFSKILFPALRVGYLVLPPDLVGRFRRYREVVDNFPAPLYQLVLAELLRDGHFARHLRRMRSVYAERREALEAALTRELGAQAQLVGDRAGMHLVMLLSPGVDDRGVAERAARAGLSVAPLSTCSWGRPRCPGLVLGYASTRVSEMTDAVRKLKGVLGGA